MKRILFCFICSLGLVGCEPEVSDNYIELSPDPGEIDMTFQLTPDNNGEIISFINYGNFRYLISVPENFVYDVEWTIDDRTISTGSLIGGFYFDTWSLEEGDHTLKCSVSTNSGTGSIADQDGKETATTEYTWTLRFIVIESYYNSLVYHVNDDRYLELTWEDISSPYFDIEYTLYKSSDNSEIKFNNREQYIDSLYFGQEARYELRALVNQEIQVYLGELYLDEAPVTCSADYSDPDSILFYWENGFNTRISVYSTDDELLVEKTTNNPVKLPYATFAAEEGTYMYPYIHPLDDTSEESYSFRADIDRSRKPLEDTGEGLLRAVYNPNEDFLYTTVTDIWDPQFTINSRTLPDLATHRSNRVKGDPPGHLISSYSDAKIASVSHGRINIFDGKDLRQITTFTPEDTWVYTLAATITNDNKLIAIAHLNTGSDLKAHATEKTLFYDACVYDIATSHLESTFEVTASNYNYRSIHFTPDARYIYATEGNIGLRITSLQDYKPTGEKSLSTTFSGWCVNPERSGQLFLSENGKITEYDAETLSKQNEWSYPDMRLCNIDPKTGNLLLSGNGTIQIISSTTGRLIYSMKVNPDTNYRLLGNTLLSENRHAMNLEQYLSK